VIDVVVTGAAVEARGHAPTPECLQDWAQFADNLASQPFAGMLYGVRLQLGGLKNGTLQSCELHAVREIDNVLDESMEALKTLTLELYPPILRTSEMSQVLRWIAEHMHERHGLETDCELDPDADSIPEDVRVILYDFVSELLFNVVKHGGVDRARVRMSRLNATKIQISVSDRG